jgi:hypothetical protein
MVLAIGCVCPLPAGVSIVLCHLLPSAPSWRCYISFAAAAWHAELPHTDIRRLIAASRMARNFVVAILTFVHADAMQSCESFRHRLSVFPLHPLTHPDSTVPCWQSPLAPTQLTWDVCWSCITSPVHHTLAFCANVSSMCPVYLWWSVSEFVTLCNLKNVFVLFSRLMQGRWISVCTKKLRFKGSNYLWPVTDI